MSGVGRNRAQGLGSRLEQDTVDHRLVVIGEVADRCWQGEDQVIVLDRQEVCLAGFKPAPGRTGLTLRTMPVPTRVVGDLGVVAGLALQHMTAQRRAATLFDSRHDLELAETEVAGS
jgi:hypothetical protein